MHSARKPRVGKPVPNVRPIAESFCAVAEICQEPRLSRANLIRSAWTEPRGIHRVPTHAISVPNERRAYSRAQLRLPLRILRIAGHRETDFKFMTVDISSSGVRTRCPFEMEVGTPVHLEVDLVKRPDDCGNVRLITQAQVVRVNADIKGWNLVAFSFDEITFERDELAMPKFARY